MPKVPQKKIVSNSVFRGGARRLRYCHLESPDDRHLPVALISVFVSYDRTVANGIRVSVLCDDFGNSEKACEEILVRSTVRMKETAFPMMDSIQKLERTCVVPSQKRAQKKESSE